MTTDSLQTGSEFIGLLNKWISTREEMLQSNSLLPSEIRYVKEQIAVFKAQKENIEALAKEVLDKTTEIGRLKCKESVYSLYEIMSSDWVILN